VDECEPLGGGGGGSHRQRRRRGLCDSAHRRGRAAQVDHIKPALKALGTKRLKLIYDGPLANFAFKCLRRYIEADAVQSPLQLMTMSVLPTGTVSTSTDKLDINNMKKDEAKTKEMELDTSGGGGFVTLSPEATESLRTHIRQTLNP